jgi:hypothetical protein
MRFSIVEPPRFSPKFFNCQGLRRAVSTSFYVSDVPPTTIAVYTSRRPHGFTVVQIPAMRVRDTVQPQFLVGAIAARGNCHRCHLAPITGTRCASLSPTIVLSVVCPGTVTAQSLHDTQSYSLLAAGQHIWHTRAHNVKGLFFSKNIFNVPEKIALQ